MELRRVVEEAEACVQGDDEISAVSAACCGVDAVRRTLLWEVHASDVAPLCLVWRRVRVCGDLCSRGPTAFLSVRGG